MTQMSSQVLIKTRLQFYILLMMLQLSRLLSRVQVSQILLLACVQLTVTFKGTGVVGSI